MHMFLCRELHLLKIKTNSFSIWVLMNNGRGIYVPQKSLLSPPFPVSCFSPKVPNQKLGKNLGKTSRKEDRKNSRIEYNVTTFALPTKMSTDTSEPTSESWKQCSGFNKEGSTFPNERVLAGVYQNFICFSLTGVPLWLGFSRQRTLLLLLWVWNNSHPLVLEHEGHTHRSIWKETK